MLYAVRPTLVWRGRAHSERLVVMRIFDTIEDAESALGRSLPMALSVGSLAAARATVVSLLGEEYIGDYLLGETVSRVFVAVRRPRGGYVFYLVEDGPSFWESAVKIAH